MVRGRPWARQSAAEWQALSARILDAMCDGGACAASAWYSDEGLAQSVYALAAIKTENMRLFRLHRSRPGHPSQYGVAILATKGARMTL